MIHNKEVEHFERQFDKCESQQIQKTLIYQ